MSKTTNKFAREVRERVLRMVVEPIGNIPPAEAEDRYDAVPDNIDMAA